MDLNHINSKSDSNRKLYFIFFLIIYFVVISYLANKVYIWEDESYSLNTSSHKMRDVISLSYRFEGQPPFYFLLLSVWRHINTGIFFARLLSIIFVGFAAFCFQRLAKLVTLKNNVEWLVILFLLNPFTVWAALEIRLYALMILLSTICGYYFFRFYLENKNKDLYKLLLISLAGLYTQYFFAFLITSFAFSLLVFRGKNVFSKFCLFFVPVILLFLPNLFFIRNQLSMAQTHLNVNGRQVFDVITTPQNFIVSLSTLPLPKLLRWIIKTSFIFLFGFAFLKLIKHPVQLKSQYVNLLKVILFILFVSVLLYLILVPSLSLIFQEKYMIVTFSFFILLFSVLNILPQSQLIYGSISLYFILLLAIKYKYPEKSYNFKRVSNYLERVEKKKEPIIFYGKSILPPFRYYYKGSNKLFTLPPLLYDKDYYEERIKDTSELNKEIKTIYTPTNSYLLVTESIAGFKYKPAMSRQMIEKSIKDRYIISLDTTIRSRNSENWLRIQRLEKD